MGKETNEVNSQLVQVLGILVIIGTVGAGLLYYALSTN